MRKGVWILKFILFALALVLAFGLVTMSLWNWLIPALFAGPTITFWQAIGLIILSKIFFWGGGKHHGRHQGGPWRHYLKHKYAKMSPEERDELKRKMKERWCSWDQSAAGEKEAGSNG